MRFIKMHGIGNDYVYVDCFRKAIATLGLEGMG
jgi:diaminopimelate epimerase